VLSVLTEKPIRIERLFETTQRNKQAIWAVKLYKNGETVEVVMDDYIPCLDGAPCFSKANGNELWVIILEKAWAKLHGSYERIEAGFAHEVMRDLTGGPSYDMEVDEEGLFDKLLAYDKKDYMMAASAGSTEASAEALEELGLVAQHSYGLLAARTITDGNGEKVELVQLRNPWGDFEWKGDWGDTSDCWTPALKKEVGLDENADDGAFWMSFKDFSYYFSRVQVCKDNDGYNYSCLKGGHKTGSFALMRLILEDDGEACISVAQKDARCFLRGTDYEYSYCRVIVMKIDTEKTDVDEDGDNLEVDYMAGGAGDDRETHLEFPNLQKGEYYVYVELDWHANTTETSFCVTCYGAAESTFTRDEKALYTKEMVLQNAFRSKAFQELPGVTKTTMADKGAPLVKKYKCFGDESYGFIIIQNDEPAAQYKEKVNFTSFKGLEFVAPESGSAYEVLVPPKGNKTIVIKCDPEGYAMATSSSSSVILGDGALEAQCLAEGKKAPRPDPDTGEQMAIDQYSLRHGGGMAYLYVNKTTEHTLEEELEFVLAGLEIEGKPGETTVELKVGPGQTKLLKLVATSPTQKVSCGVSYAILKPGDESD